MTVRMDIGGAECPRWADQEASVIVDIYPTTKWRAVAEDAVGSLHAGTTYLWRDCRVNSWAELLPQADEIFLGAIIRQLQHDCGWLVGDPLDLEIIRKFIASVAGLHTGQGSITVRDHKSILNEVTSYLTTRGYRVVRDELMEDDDEDYEETRLITYARK